MENEMRAVYSYSVHLFNVCLSKSLSISQTCYTSLIKKKNRFREIQYFETLKLWTLMSEISDQYSAALLALLSINSLTLAAYNNLVPKIHR